MKYLVRTTANPLHLCEILPMTPGSDAIPHVKVHSVEPRSDERPTVLAHIISTVIAHSGAPHSDGIESSSRTDSTVHYMAHPSKICNFGRHFLECRGPDHAGPHAAPIRVSQSTRSETQP